MSVQVDEHRLIASICKESFYEFVKEFWDVVVPEDPVWNWHIEFLCNEMQKMAERVFVGKKKTHDLIVNISPGTTKSTIFSVMFCPWAWTNMESIRVICGSYAYNLAMDLSRKSRDVVKSAKYQSAFPKIVIRDDQNTKGYWANTLGGMRYAVGIGGSVTGMHGHFQIVDDPIDPQQAVSEPEIKTANNWMNETLPSRKVDKEVCPLVLIQQRLHQNDPTGNRLAKGIKAGKVRHICLPADMSEGYDVKPRYLRRRYEHGLMDPVRLSREVLKEERARLGEYGYAGQYGQSPVPLGGGMFKVTRLSVDKYRGKFKQLVRFWDKAATRGGGAYTVGVLMGEDIESRFWVLDVCRGQWDSSEREKIIKKVAIGDGRIVRIGLEQEPGSGGKESAENTVKMLAGYRVKAYPVGQSEGNKELRADPFSTQVNSANVYIYEDNTRIGYLISGTWLANYVDEMRYFPASTYKDQIDASSGAFNMLTRPRMRVGAL